MICIACPLGCQLKVSKIEAVYLIEGNQCHKGREYALEESANPKRIVTTTVKLKKSMEQLPVRTKSPIPKAKMKACINCLKSIQVDMPIEIGQVIVENILDTDVSVVASKTIKENIKNRASTRF